MLGLVLLCVALSFMLLNGLMRPGSESRKRGLYIAFILLVLVAGSRNALVDFGSDLNNYYRLYHLCINSFSLPEVLEKSTMEKGYVFLNFAFSRVIQWPQFIVFFQAAFCIGISLYFIYKNSTDTVLSVLGFISLGVLQFYLTGFRQSMAIAICLLALQCALNNRKIAFLLLVAIASLIHQTAIVFAPVIVLVNIKINRLSFFVDLIAIVVLFIFIPNLMRYGNDLFQKEYAGDFIGNAFGGAITVVFGVLTTCFLVKKRNTVFNGDVKPDGFSSDEYIQKVSRNYKMVHLLIIGTAIYAMRYQTLVFERVALFFLPVLFILLPQALQLVFAQGKNYSVIRASAIIAMLFLIYWRFSQFDYIVF